MLDNPKKINVIGMSPERVFWKTVLPFLSLYDRVKLRLVCKLLREVVDDSWQQIQRLKICWDYYSEAIYTSIAIHNELSIDTYSEKAHRVVEQLMMHCSSTLNCLDEFIMAEELCSKLALAILLDTCPLNCHIEDWTVTATSKFVNQHLEGLLQRLVMMQVDHRYLKRLSINVYRPSRLRFLNIPAGLLQHFSLRHGSNCDRHNHVMLSIIRDVVTKAPALKSVDTDQLDDEILNIISHRTKLKSFQFRAGYSPAVTVGGLFRISELRNLQYINFTSGDYFWKNRWIDERFVRGMVKNCRELSEIHFMDCDTMTDKCLLLLADLPKLESLEIRAVKRVTDQYLNRFTHLKWLDVSMCSSICDEGVMKLLMESNRLTTFDLRATGITERTLNAANRTVSEWKSGRHLSLILGFAFTDQCFEEKKSPKLHISFMED